MFKNYSETYANQIAQVVGLAVILCRLLGVEFAESDIAFAAALLVNLYGAGRALVLRYKQGGVNVLGQRV